MDHIIDISGCIPETNENLQQMKIDEPLKVRIMEETEALNYIIIYKMAQKVRTKYSRKSKLKLGRQKIRVIIISILFVYLCILEK